MLRLTSLCKSYGDSSVLRNLDLEVRAGEVCAVLGRNGAGKTTLFSLVAGVLSPDSGSIRIRGIDAASDPRRARSNVGLGPQELSVYPTLDGWANLRLPGRLAGLRGRDLQRRIERLSEALDIRDQLDKPAQLLSGGQKRRLHAAMAMVAAPPLLLLDEPTAGVDVETRMRLLSEVSRMAREDGAAVCYSTHYFPEVEALRATVAILENGRIMARGTVDELVRSFEDSQIVLKFDGPAPRLPNGVCEPSGCTLSVPSEKPDVDVPVVLGLLGSYLERLVSLEIVRPSLEAVYLSIVGSREPCA
jgi:ABC-2 type transport system ATP-binding protein